MSSVSISTGSFVSVLLRSTRELQVLFWCFLDGFVIALESNRKCGIKIAPEGIQFEPRKALFMPAAVHIFLMVAGKGPELLLREMTLSHWHPSFFLYQMVAKVLLAGIEG